jgi:hypothetical protein
LPINPRISQVYLRTSKSLLLRYGMRIEILEGPILVSISPARLRSSISFILMYGATAIAVVILNSLGVSRRARWQTSLIPISGSSNPFENALIAISLYILFEIKSSTAWRRFSGIG